MPPARIIFDVSTTARYAGAMGGLGRVEGELALHAWETLPDVEFSFFDHSRGCFRRVKREWLPRIVGTEAMLDTSRVSAIDKWNGLLRLPSDSRLRGPISWLRSPRRNVIAALERWRLTSSSTVARAAANRFLRIGSGFAPRIAVLPEDVVLGEAFDLDPGCVLVSAGNDWSFKDMDRIAALKARHGFRYVILCHDLILVQFPELVSPAAAEQVRNYWRKTIPITDLVIFTSRKVEEDFRDYCAANAMPLPAFAFAPLGANPAQFNQPSDTPLPPSLSKDRYVLMVGGIAPRKGHDVLIAAWNRLFAEGIPQSCGFKLVLAGKLGKGVPRAAQLLAENFSGDTLVHLPLVDDALLAALYRNCAFTVLPSLYEGFGLPIVESFAFGKPVIASTGGAIPEVVAGFSPCLDPLDEDAWYNEMRQWIVDRTPRDYFADKIRREYRLRSWQEATRDFFAAISS